MRFMSLSYHNPKFLLYPLEFLTYVEDTGSVPVVGVTVQVVPSTGIRVHVSAVLVPPSVVGLTAVPVGVAMI